MESKIKKSKTLQVNIDTSLNKFENKELFPLKTEKFNEMISRIGKENFLEITNTKMK
jgi:hypothetical protein